MKRLILSLTAALLVAGPLPGSVAVAKDKQGGWEQQRGGGGGNRGGGPERGGGGNRGGGNGGWRGDDRGGPDRRIENRPAPDRRIENRPAPERRNENRPAPERRQDERRMEGRRDDGPRWERPNPEAQRAPGEYGVRRGGYMPPNVGAPVEDHNRLRLRTPPRGYSWVRVPGGYAMVSEQTGQIFDMVPTR